MRGVLRAGPEDFEVVEIIDFELSGDGEHDYLWIEKIRTNTAWVARGLAHFAGVPQRDVGYAGLKDRDAVTRQWFSVRRPGGPGADWEGLRMPGVRVLAVTRHRRKLRRGAHRGNAFRIALRDTAGSHDEAVSVLDRIARGGVPNYFGEQRFGHGAGNLLLARRLFAGGRLRRGERSFAISAARSWLYNHVLEARVTDGSWNRLVPGDLANLDGSGSIFPVDEVDDELERRAAALDLHPSGPLWGRGRPSCGGDVLRLEQQVAAASADFSAGLEHCAEHARRALRIRVEELRWDRDGDVLRVGFFLGRGGFATAVLRELADYRAGMA